MILGCNNQDAEKSKPESLVKAIGISVVKVYPHDTASFTQGLAFYKGKMYEGTGGAEYDPGSRLSRLMQVDLNTGKAEKSVTLPGKYFGEGITILNDTLYQLTWREHTVLVYTLPDLKKVKEFSISTEGWGITHNGQELIVSDGSSNLYFYEPATFRLLRSQSITQDGELVNNINELEFIDGSIYANQWQYPYILKINPETGIIDGIVNLSMIWDKLKRNHPQAANDVPNGIAYDAATKKIYITGKNWPELYEVQFGQ